MLLSPGDEGAEATNNDSAYATMWGPSEMCFNGTFSDWDITFRLKDVRCPTLITAGRYDSISGEMTELLGSLIPRSRVEWFEESSSMPFYEEAAKFARVSNEFLEKIGAREL
jgi:proline iminopeptidase